MVIHVEDAKSNTSICQVPTNGHLDGGQTVIGEGVSTSHDGKYIDSGGKASNRVDFGGR
jgi:hypothetical protein